MLMNFLFKFITVKKLLNLQFFLYPVRVVLTFLYQFSTDTTSTAHINCNGHSYFYGKLLHLHHGFSF